MGDKLVSFPQVGWFFIPLRWRKLLLCFKMLLPTLPLLMTFLPLSWLNLWFDLERCSHKSHPLFPTLLRLTSFFYSQYDHLILAYEFPFYFAWQHGFTILDIHILLFIEIFERVSAERLTLSIMDEQILAWANEKCPGWVLIWSTEFLYRSRGESSKTHLSCFDTVRPRAYFYCVHLGEIRQGIIPSNEIRSLQTLFSLVTRSHCALSEIHFEGNSVTCLQCAN